MVDSLLVCPFCGNKPVVKDVFGRGWIVECPNILCVQQRYGHPTKEDAVADWNKRVKPMTLEEVYEKIESDYVKKVLDGKTLKDLIAGKKLTWEDDEVK